MSHDGQGVPSIDFKLISTVLIHYIPLHVVNPNNVVKGA